MRFSFLTVVILSLAKRSMQESMNSVVEYFAKYYGASVIMFSMAPGDDDSPIIRWYVVCVREIDDIH